MFRNNFRDISLRIASKSLSSNGNGKEKMVSLCARIILWLIDPLLSNDRETNNETTDIVRQQIRKYAAVLKLLLGNCPRATLEVLLEAVLSMWPAPRLYHSTGRVQFSAMEWSAFVGEQSVRGLLLFSRCEPVLLETGSFGTGIFRQPRRRGTSDFGNSYQATIANTWLWTLVCVTVNCKV
jgi:hypothetical protein